MAPKWMLNVHHSYLTTKHAFMRGVDRSDQLIGLYNIGRRSKKWWKRVFSHVLECAILNAYVLDSHIHPLEHALRGRKRDYLTFRLQLTEELIGGFSSRKRAGRRPSGEHLNMQRLTIDLGHWPEQSPKSLGCVVCKTKKSRHESCIICSVCKVHLCIHGSRDCFKKYHTLVYWH